MARECVTVSLLLLMEDGLEMTTATLSMEEVLACLDMSWLTVRRGLNSPVNLRSVEKDFIFGMRMENAMVWGPRDPVMRQRLFKLMEILWRLDVKQTKMLPGYMTLFLLTRWH